MQKKIAMLFVAMLAVGCMAFSAQHVFYGVVTDSMCGMKHSRASANAAQCVKGCVAKGAQYELSSRGKLYKLTPQDKFADYAGMRVRVHGSLSGDTITADTVTHVRPRKSAASTSSGM
jgi:hypothetical protein